VGRFRQCGADSCQLFGTDSALGTLQTGQKSGKKDYENALEDEGVMTECKEMIRSGLLPKVNEHISTFERLQQST
jgi:hypothetical protein